MINGLDAECCGHGSLLQEACGKSLLVIRCPIPVLIQTHSQLLLTLPDLNQKVPILGFCS